MTDSILKLMSLLNILKTTLILYLILSEEILKIVMYHKKRNTIISIYLLLLTL